MLVENVMGVMLAFSSSPHFLRSSLISFCFIFHHFLLPLHFNLFLLLTVVSSPSFLLREFS